MASSTVEAQKLANAANLEMNKETNQANKDIAADSNELNYRLFQEQNTWNRQQWEDELAYNDPSAQMQRYIKAGINPNLAISQGDPGNAQRLVSADAPSAVVPTMTPGHVEPEYDPFVGAKLQSIVGALGSVLNGAQGFSKLYLDSLDVDTRKAAQQSESSLQAAQSAYIRSQTVGQDLFNNLNKDTYMSQVQSRALQVSQIRTEIDSGKLDQALTTQKIANEKELNNQIRAQTDYIYAQTSSAIDATKIAWQQLAVNKRNADTQDFSARSQSYYQGEELKQRGREFEFNREATVSQLEQKSTHDIMQWFLQKRGKLEQIVGSPGVYFFGPNSNSEFNTPYGIISEMQCAGEVIKKRISEQPWNSEAIKSFDDWQKSMQSLPQPPSYMKGLPDVDPIQGFSVLNPSDY